MGKLDLVSASVACCVVVWFYFEFNSPNQTGAVFLILAVPALSAFWLALRAWINFAGVLFVFSASGAYAFWRRGWRGIFAFE